MTWRVQLVVAQSVAAAACNWNVKGSTLGGAWVFPDSDLAETLWWRCNASYINSGAMHGTQPGNGKRDKCWRYSGTVGGPRYIRTVGYVPPVRLSRVIVSSSLPCQSHNCQVKRGSQTVFEVEYGSNWSRDEVTSTSTPFLKLSSMVRSFEFFHKVRTLQ